MINEKKLKDRLMQSVEFAKENGEYNDEASWSYQQGVILDYKEAEHICSLLDVVGRSEQLSLSDFRVGFEYEELQMDSERYLNRGMIWVKKTYGLNSPRLHKIQKLIEEGKLRKA